MELYFKRKIAQSRTEVITRSIIAGFFIAMGAFFFLVIKSELNNALASGMVFSMGLIFCVLLHADLFTGDCLMLFGKEKKVGSYLTWVYCFNCVGALLTAFLIYCTGIAPEATIPVAEAKINLSPMEIFFRGVMCNMLVCVAVLAAYTGHTIVGKVCAIIPPITLFSAVGFEHSIGQMLFLPLAMLQGAEFGVMDVIIKVGLTTLGNIVGGLLVSLAFIFLLKGADVRD